MDLAVKEMNIGVSSPSEATGSCPADLAGGATPVLMIPKNEEHGEVREALSDPPDAKTVVVAYVSGNNEGVTATYQREPLRGEIPWVLVNMQVRHNRYSMKIPHTPLQQAATTPSYCTTGGKKL